MIGLALAALWVALTVTRAVVGGLVWVVLAAAVVALVIGVVQSMRGKRGPPTRSRTPA